MEHMGVFQKKAAMDVAVVKMEILCLGPSDVLGQNLLELQRQIGQILRKSEEEKKEAEERHQRLQKEVSALQERARQAPEDYKKACTKAADARIQMEQRQHEAAERQHEAAERQHEAAERQLENQVQRLNQKLRTMEEIQGLADQQLLEAEEERERLLAELHQLEAEVRYSLPAGEPRNAAHTLLHPEILPIHPPPHPEILPILPHPEIWDLTLKSCPFPRHSEILPIPPTL
ncbi:centriolin-like [Anomaloglossus baeobatrachus]|uniref:centriolin-like n=1 Tax=Anomaloglossus baeobatrachus TaxID=238106 RepID=UPI003F50CADD